MFPSIEGLILLCTLLTGGRAAVIDNSRQVSKESSSTPAEQSAAVIKLNISPITATLIYRYQCRGEQERRIGFGFGISVVEDQFYFNKGPGVDVLIGPSTDPNPNGADAISGHVGFSHQSCEPRGGAQKCVYLFAGSIITNAHKVIWVGPVTADTPGIVKPRVVKTCAPAGNLPPHSCPTVDPNAEHCRIVNFQTTVP